VRGCARMGELCRSFVIQRNHPNRPIRMNLCQRTRNLLVVLGCAAERGVGHLDPCLQQSVGSGCFKGKQQAHTGHTHPPAWPRFWRAAPTVAAAAPGPGQPPHCAGASAQCGPPAAAPSCPWQRAAAARQRWLVQQACRCRVQGRWRDVFAGFHDSWVCLYACIGLNGPHWPHFSAGGA
jgi:hypothetical protein